MIVAASRENAKDVEAVTSADPGIEYTVAWVAVSVHVPGQDEPVTVARGENLPAEAADQGPFLRSIGAVSASAKA
ncbi:MAG TPA: hypothetical protein PKL08_00790 [Thermoanaerobaculaceae bacterium]|nr:hypothetical protein [Thermoanaerobaculaceae bacterium]